jgi:hypothetical protein
MNISETRPIFLIFQIDLDFEIFQYAMSVVPTLYIDRGGDHLFTNQYAVTDFHRTFQEGQAVPGIFFKYDVEPISVSMKEQRESFLHFIVRLCGILGGSVVSVGTLYRLITLVWTGGKEDPKLYTPVHNMMKGV